MADEIKVHELNGYNLKINDDDYQLYCKHYKVIAENANDCWKGFIDICSKLKGSAIKGQFADKLEEMVAGYGKGPGEDLFEVVSVLSAEMEAYVSEIDAADGSLY
jgi:hypothetical protein